MTDNGIISIGDDFRRWPRKFWGSRDREVADALDAQTRRLRETGPLLPPPPNLVSFSLYEDRQGDRDRRRREIDRLLEKHGLIPRRW